MTAYSAGQALGDDVAKRIHPTSQVPKKINQKA